MDPERAIARIVRCIAVLTIAGVAAAFVFWGWRAAAGFLLGAAASALNFRWLKKAAYSLGEASAGKPPRARIAVLAGLRYLVLGAGAYVIVKYSLFSVTALLAGLFVPVAAVILEMLFELVYAGTS